MKIKKDVIQQKIKICSLSIFLYLLFFTLLYSKKIVVNDAILTPIIDTTYTAFSFESSIPTNTIEKTLFADIDIQVYDSNFDTIYQTKLPKQRISKSFSLKEILPDYLNVDRIFKMHITTSNIYYRIYYFSFFPIILFLLLTKIMLFWVTTRQEINEKIT